MRRAATEMILRLLRERVGPNEPIHLLEIEPILAAQDFTQKEILFALEYLHAHKAIEMMPGNRVRLLQ